MTLILRKCQKNGLSRNNFRYGNTGDIVTAPDWYPSPECGYGLHGLKEGNGDWSLLEGSDWIIIEANDKDIIDIDGNKCKFRTGKILFRGTTKQLSESEFPNKLNLNSESAFYWAKRIGNEDIMINKIADNCCAYWWARDIGNHDIMIHKITDSKYAYLWAKNIGNRDIMINKITNEKSVYPFSWALDIGNHDVMMHKITESEYAYYWAKYIGHHDIMKPKVTDSYYIKQWNVHFHNNKIKEV